MLCFWPQLFRKSRHRTNITQMSNFSCACLAPSSPCALNRSFRGSCCDPASLHRTRSFFPALCWWDANYFDLFLDVIFTKGIISIQALLFSVYLLLRRLLWFDRLPIMTAPLSPLCLTEENVRSSQFIKKIQKFTKAILSLLKNWHQILYVTTSLSIKVATWAFSFLTNPRFLKWSSFSAWNFFFVKIFFCFMLPMSAMLRKEVMCYPCNLFIRRLSAWLYSGIFTEIV